MKPTVEEARLNLERVEHDIERKYDPHQIAMDRMFGLTHRQSLVPGHNGLMRVVQGEALPPGPAFESLGEAYVTLNGDPSYHGFGKSRITALSTPDFQSALTNTMNALLLRDYAGDAIYRWREIVTSTTAAPNFKPQQRSRIRHVEDLPDVAEDVPYDELVSHGDEGFTFSVTKKGGLLTVTERMVVNDDVGAIQRLVEQGARAAWRTLAKRCWAKLINNENYGVDGLAMFHSDHANLGSAALSVAGLNTARAAIFAQTEPGSTERLGLSGPWLLVVPGELEPTAFAINNSEFVPGTTDGSANPWYKRFGQNGERIFANPLFGSEANDWMLLDTSGNAGIIEVAFLLGKQAPQIIASNDPREGQRFTQDRYRWKLRHEYECNIVDFRAGYKSVVG